MSNLQEAFKAYVLPEPGPWTEWGSRVTPHERGDLHITRTSDGFDVSGVDSYFCRVPLDRLDQLMDTVLVPMLERNQAMTLDDLVSASRPGAQRMGIHEIPWTAVYLLARWRRAQSETEGHDPQAEAADSIERRMSSLLEDWYQADMQMHPHAVGDRQ